MISKDAFVKIMDGLRDYWDELHKTMQHLDVVFEENYLTRVADNTLDALCRDMEADLDADDIAGPWCYYFAFELDWGRNTKYNHSVRIDGEIYPLENASQLYNLLIMLNDQAAFEREEQAVMNNWNKKVARYMKRNCPECGAELVVYYDGPHCSVPEPWLIRHCENCNCDWESEWHEDGRESELQRKFWG
jgi:DNA-directed RNA polymerase subunit M/transcription elongation factor TFIIS